MGTAGRGSTFAIKLSSNDSSSDCTIASTITGTNHWAPHICRQPKGAANQLVVRSYSGPRIRGRARVASSTSSLGLLPERRSIHNACGCIVGTGCGCHDANVWANGISSTFDGCATIPTRRYSDDWTTTFATVGSRTTRVIQVEDGSLSS